MSTSSRPGTLLRSAPESWSGTPLRYVPSMNHDMNDILCRQSIVQEITEILNQFDAQCRCTNFKKGIYIYGSPGCGKTYFVTSLLKSLNYDVIQYDAGDVRNKSLIDTITCDNISNRNVLEMMYGRTKKIAIVMDEIDGMNNGDKGGITQLIKLIRQKKTKKQKLESVTLNPIICIGNYYVDKKIKELMKVCHVFELKPITRPQIERLLLGTERREATKGWANSGPKIDQQNVEQLVDYIQGDLRKLHFIERMLAKKPDLFSNSDGHSNDILKHILEMKSYNDDAKQITKSLINNPVSIHEHPYYMNETDRTIIALLFHENIVDTLFTSSMVGEGVAGLATQKNAFYAHILRNICFADHIDRITFQNQIWVFNEMSSLIKTFYNNFLYHKTFPELRNHACTNDIRFTKVLTKYSTEYNNQLFNYNLCQELEMDKKDVVALFQELRLFYGKECLNQPDTLTEIECLFEFTTIRRLDIKRMYRYLDKNVKVEMVQDMEEVEVEDED